MRHEPTHSRPNRAPRTGGEGVAIMPERPLIVLDTNVVFDWLVFDDPACAPLRHAIECRQIRWIATPRMHDECFHVIGRGALDARAPDIAAIRAAWADHCSIVAPPSEGSPPGHPRCNDAEDQMFIDLAIFRHARWLISRDRAVLRLSARLARLGVVSASPVTWTQLQPARASESHESAPRPIR